MAAEETSKTIDELPEKSTLSSGDMIPVDDGTQTYHVLWSTILNAAGGIRAVTESGNAITITLNDGTEITVQTSDDTKQDKLTWDSTPTAGSSNPVTSSGIYAAVNTVASDLSDTDARIAANTAAISSEASRAKEAETANADAIAKLNGDKATEGSVANTVAEQIAELVAEAPESLDTLKEIAAWIESHADDAAAMNKNIQANAAAIEKEAERAVEAEDAITERLDSFGIYLDEDGDICQE